MWTTNRGAILCVFILVSTFDDRSHGSRRCERASRRLSIQMRGLVVEFQGNKETTKITSKFVRLRYRVDKQNHAYLDATYLQTHRFRRHRAQSYTTTRFSHSKSGRPQSNRNLVFMYILSGQRREVRNSHANANGERVRNLALQRLQSRNAINVQTSSHQKRTYVWCGQR